MRPLSQPGNNRRRSRYVLLVLTLLAITVITLDARGVPVLSSAKDGSRDVLSPVRGAAHWVSTPFRNAWNGISGYDDLQRENEDLRQQIDDLNTNAMRETSAQKELALLKEQLDLGVPPNIPTQLARVSGGAYSNFADHTVELDEGSDRGLAVGNPVITKGGLVGRIIDVSRTRSVVQLITDPDFFIGVTVGAAQQWQGVGHGAGNSTTFIVDSVDLKYPVQPKDPVVAGGIENSIMPPDMFMPVGTVDKVTSDEAAQVQVLQVNLSANFRNLDVVQVLKWVPPS